MGMTKLEMIEEMTKLGTKIKVVNIRYDFVTCEKNSKSTHGDDEIGGDNSISQYKVWLWG